MSAAQACWRSIGRRCCSWRWIWWSSGCSVDPASNDLLFEKGYLLNSWGGRRRREALYRQLLDAHPTHLGALTHLGNMLFASEGWWRQAQLYLRAVRAYPNHIASRTSLGNLLLKSNQSAGAREQFEAALRIDPEYRAAHAGLAYVMEKTGRRGSGGAVSQQGVFRAVHGERCRIAGRSSRSRCCCCWRRRRAMFRRIAF